MAPRSKKDCSRRLPDDVVSLEVTGPKALLRDPVLRRVKKSQKLKDVVGKFLGQSKLEGYRATKVKGSVRESIGLDKTVDDFVNTFKRPPAIIRMRLTKPIARPATEIGSPVVPEIVMVEEEEDPTIDVDFMLSLNDLISDQIGMEDSVDQDSANITLSGTSTQQKPVELATSIVSPSPSSPPVTPKEQQPGSSRVMREEMARERLREKRAARHQRPSSSSVVGLEKKRVVVKKEPPALTIKEEFPDAATTIAGLRSRGVSIDNMKALTQARIRQFNNPFLLLVRQEIRDLQRNSFGCPEWQRVVAKAPKCAYMINELFKDGPL